MPVKGKARRVQSLGTQVMTSFEEERVISCVECAGEDMDLAIAQAFEQNPTVD